MNTNEKMRNLDEDYIIAFRNILKEAERKKMLSALNNLGCSNRCNKKDKDFSSPA